MQARFYEHKYRSCMLVFARFSLYNSSLTSSIYSCDKDPTIVHLTTGLRQTHRFTLQVFRFLVNHTLVYIHCNLRLCNRNIPNSLCTRSTTCPVRSRRDATSRDDTYPVSIGPLISRETNSGLLYSASSSICFELVLKTAKGFLR